MDKPLLTSYVRELFRSDLNNRNYKIKKSARQHLIDVANQAYKMAQNGTSMKEIYLEIGKKELSDKYNVILDKKQLKNFKDIINTIKSMPIPSHVKGKPYEQAHIVLIHM